MFNYKDKINKLMVTRYEPMLCFAGGLNIWFRALIKLLKSHSTKTWVSARVRQHPVVGPVLCLLPTCLDMPAQETCNLKTKLSTETRVEKGCPQKCIWRRKAWKDCKNAWFGSAKPPKEIKLRPLSFFQGSTHTQAAGRCLPAQKWLECAISK